MKTILEDSQNERLVLKNLKKVNVIFFESKSSIDFLLGISKTLVELKLGLDLDEAAEVDNEYIPNYLVELDNKNNDSRRNHVIKFVGYASKMMESNIWEFFPALKKIEFGMCHYVKIYEREC